MDDQTKKTIRVVLEGQGFRSKSGSWYRDEEETVLVVNFQRSNYSELYYVNLAVWVKALGVDPHPKENKCHVRMRLDSLTDERSASFFDMEDGTFDLETRTTGIESVLFDVAIPFLKGCKSMSGIAELFRNGKLKKAMVHRRVKELLPLE